MYNRNLCAFPAIAVFALAGSALGQATVETVNLAPGGMIDYVEPAGPVGGPTMYRAYMTTPLGMPAGGAFEDPDTVLELREGGSLLHSNDDAGGDGADGLQLFSPRGSLLRFTQGETARTVRVRGFNAGESGPVAVTRVAFTDPAMLPQESALGPTDFATPGMLPVSRGGAIALSANLDPGDFDLYCVSAQPGDLISIFTIPVGAPNSFSSPDTTMGVFDPDFGFLVFNDDAGGDYTAAATVARGSAIRYLTSTGGQVCFAIQGFEGEPGPYVLAVSVVGIPAPGAGAMCLLGALGLARRRR